VLSSLALAAHVHRVELSQSPAFSSGSDRSGATAWEIVAPQRDGEGDDGESCYNERGYTRPRHALAAGCRIKRVCRPTLSLTLAAGTTSARLPITELIVATLAHSASAPTQQHLREVIALYEQWAAGTVKSPAFYISSASCARSSIRGDPARSSWRWFAAVVVTDPRCEKG